LWRCSLREIQSEENNDRGDEETSVQTGGRDVVVLHPPSSVLALDEPVEGKANDAPAEVDVYGRGWDPAGSSEHEWPVHISEPGTRPFARHQVTGDRECGTDKPEPLQDSVNLTWAENTSWANGTPYDGCGVEDSSTWAGVLILLVVIADVWNVAHSPVVDCNLYDGRPEDGDALSPEHGAGRHFHVMPHLEILQEVKRLGHADVAVALEDHHGDWAAGKHVTDDELGDDIQTDLPVGNGLDHADGNEEDDWDDHTDDE